MENNQQTTCSSGGNNYAIQCGILYEGVEIDTSDIDETSGADSGTSGMSGSDMDMRMLAKRALEPDLASCQALCDRTTGCKAFNYVGTNCTLLSQVT